MKRYLPPIFLIILSFAMSQKVCAYSFESDGIFYNILSESEKTIAVTYKNTSFNSYSGEVTVPSTVVYGNKTYVVTTIGERAFLDCKTLTKVVMPTNLNEIGDNAFYYCSNLENAEIPPMVTSIGEGAFYGCIKLRNVIIPSGTTFVGDNAFRYCKSIESVYIPKNVLTIGKFAFGDCPSITSFEVEEGNKNYDSRNNCNALIETTTNKLLLGTKNTVIPNSVIEIGDMSFYNITYLESLDLPLSVTKIGYMAFSGCTNLKTVKMTDSVTEIGYDLFEGCSKLSNVALSNSITAIPKETFNGCSSLREVNIPKGIRTIGQSAFSECVTLEKIEIPSSVTYISNYALCRCTSLRDIYLYTKDDPIYVSWLVFNDVNVDNITLHVRHNRKALYENEDVWVWSSFNNIVEMPAILGDVNDDEQVNAMDAIALISAYTNGKTESIDNEVGDVNHDGTINAMDAIEIINKYINNK